MAYDLEVAKVGSSHLKTEPTMKKTTEFYHPKENREKNMASDRKLPGFYLDDNESPASGLGKSDSYDQFNFWREPVHELEDGNVADLEGESNEPGDFLEALNKYLLSRPFLSGFEVTGVDGAVLSHLELNQLDEDLHLNILRWSQNIQSYDDLDTEHVNISKVMEYVRNDQDFRVEDVQAGDEVDEEEDEDSNNDHGYDSDKENDGDSVEEDDDDEDGWITPSNLKSKKAALTGVQDDVQTPEKMKVALMTTDFAMQNVCKQVRYFLSLEIFLLTTASRWG